MQRVEVDLKQGQPAFGDWMEDDDARAERDRIQELAATSVGRTVWVEIGGRDAVRAEDITAIRLRTQVLPSSSVPRESGITRDMRF